MNYNCDWKNVSWWLNDGTLKYDDGNDALYFDTDAEYAHCSATVTVPDGKEGVECVFVAGNASPPGVTSGKFELTFYDENDTKLNSTEVLVKDKDEFYRYTSAGTDGAVVMPGRTKYIKFSIETHKGKRNYRYCFSNVPYSIVCR